MNILFITYHGCIRSIKQALALESTHNIHYASTIRPQFWEVFKTYTQFAGIQQYREMIKLYSDKVDVIHVGNEPNWLLYSIKELTDKPLVFDVHDSMDYRGLKGEYKSSAERLAFDLADGTVFVSEPCQHISLKNHPQVAEKPHCILPSYVPGFLYKDKDWPWRGGVVYQGGMMTEKNQEFMQYANFKETAEAFMAENIPFNAYTTDPKKKLEYYGNEVIMQGCKAYNDLLKEMGQYDWGFLGNIKEYENWQVALPNKLFEYMAGGIPVVCMNAKLCGDFVEEHGVGIHVKNVKELKERWGERAKCQINVIKKRRLWAMENHIENLNVLYGEVTNGSKIVPIEEKTA